MEWKHNFRRALMSRERVSLNWGVPPQNMLSRSRLVFKLWSQTTEMEKQMPKYSRPPAWLSDYNPSLSFIALCSLLLLFQNQRRACLPQNLPNPFNCTRWSKKRDTVSTYINSSCYLLPLLWWHRDHLLHFRWISGTEELIRNWKVCDLWIKWSENKIW